MKKLLLTSKAQEGFVTMLVCVLVVITGVIYLCYHMVTKAHGA